jgi:hypothetical protein
MLSLFLVVLAACSASGPVWAVGFRSPGSWPWRPVEGLPYCGVCMACAVCVSVMFSRLLHHWHGRSLAGISSYSW